MSWSLPYCVLHSELLTLLSGFGTGVSVPFYSRCCSCHTHDPLTYTSRHQMMLIADTCESFFLVMGDAWPQLGASQKCSKVSALEATLTGDGDGTG